MFAAIAPSSTPALAVLIFCFVLVLAIVWVAGTMAGSGARVQSRVVWQIVIAWVATLPATVVLSGALFWLLTAG